MATEGKCDLIDLFFYYSCYIQYLDRSISGGGPPINIIRTSELNQGLIILQFSVSLDFYICSSPAAHIILCKNKNVIFPPTSGFNVK